MARYHFVGIAFAMSTSAALATEPEISGSVGLQWVEFENAGLLASQSETSQVSLTFDGALRWGSDDRKTRLEFGAFGRLDELDDERTHLEVTEAYLARSFGQVEVLAGVNRVFWGVTESRHLVDIVNQVDQLEFTDSDARLGQLMLMASYQSEIGNLSALVMPGFRERSFPGPEGRFGFGLPVDESAASFEDPDGDDAIDVALRYSGNFGPLDLGVSWFKGTSREPTFSLNGGGTALVPNYAEIEQVGLDLQYTQDAILLKLEAIRRRGQGRGFEAAVLGFEYTLYQVMGSAGDLGVIGEYLYDGRDATAPTTVFQDDVFVGLRWAANDTQDTSLLFGAVVDRDYDTKLLRVEFDRRLGDHYTLEIAGSAMLDPDASDPAYPVRKDNYLSIGVALNF